MENNIEYYPIEFDEQGSRFKIINNGTAPAPCVLTIIPKVDFLKLTVSGLTELPFSFTGLKTNQALVIDGENRTITVDGVDAMSRYDGWEFPKLMPGDNQITIENGTSASIQIEYSANYI